MSQSLFPVSFPVPGTGQKLVGGKWTPSLWVWHGPWVLRGVDTLCLCANFTSWTCTAWDGPLSRFQFSTGKALSWQFISQYLRTSFRHVIKPYCWARFTSKFDQVFSNIVSGHPCREIGECLTIHSHTCRDDKWPGIEAIGCPALTKVRSTYTLT